jgi:acylglycerol lipase
VLVHGLSQHKESLDLIATTLAEDGYLTLAIDQRGHGQWHSAGRKGTEGYLCDYKGTVNDLVGLVSDLKRKNNDLPIFLMGESIGASVVLQAATQVPDKVHGIILCSCAARTTKFKTSWVLKDVLKKMINPRSEISLAKYQSEYACENKATLAETMEDKEARSGLRGREILQTKRYFAANMKYAKRLDPSTDLLLLSGSLDKLTLPVSCRKLINAANSNNKELVTIRNSGHMMIGRPDVFPQTKAVVLNWLNAESNNKSAALSEPM